MHDVCDGRVNACLVIGWNLLLCVATITDLSSDVSSVTAIADLHGDFHVDAIKRLPRVVGLADLHGDYQHTIHLLKRAGLIDVDVIGTNDDIVAEDGHPFSYYRKNVLWIGGNTTLVQTGDLVDRGRYGRDLYALFADLRAQARTNGGMVINLIGNHDMMNMLHDLRYVSKQDVAEFGGSELRSEAFSPHGWIGSQVLEDFRALVVVGNTLFVHAGLLPVHAELGVEALNRKACEQLRAAATVGKRSRFDSSLLEASGPFWVRHFARSPESVMCSDLNQTLSHVGAKRMVVGHTQVREGTVRAKCGGRFIMADTVISESGYPSCWQQQSWLGGGCTGSLSYVEIVGDQVFGVRVPLDDTLPLIRSEIAGEADSEFEL